MSEEYYEVGPCFLSPLFERGEEGEGRGERREERRARRRERGEEGRGGDTASGVNVVLTLSIEIDGDFFEDGQRRSPLLYLPHPLRR